MKLINTLILFALLSLTAACLSPTASASYPFMSSPLRAPDSSGSQEDVDGLKIAALEGLMSAPPERSLPLVRRVLQGNSSTSVKRKALFVLGQQEQSEAQDLLLQYASRAGDLQMEAIRMVGVGGNRDSLTKLRAIYNASPESIQHGVLQAFLIADDTQSVYQIAQAAKTDEQFDAAIKTLGAMDAIDELRLLFDKGGDRESLVRAYAIAGDLESLSRMAREGKSENQQMAAIRGIGIVGSEAAQKELEEIYLGASQDAIRDAALKGMIISDHDQGVLNLFRQSSSVKDKKKLMRALVAMDSDLAIDVIDSALLGED
ncbi:MAG: hypothetical protein AB8G18_09590 [Gammaproteobacteria bacterium]